MEPTLSSRNVGFYTSDAGEIPKRTQTKFSCFAAKPETRQSNTDKLYALIPRCFIQYTLHCGASLTVTDVNHSKALGFKFQLLPTRVKGTGNVHPCTGTEAL